MFMFYQVMYYNKSSNASSRCFFFLFLRFDVADRLFFSIEASFNSVLNSLNDCKEITPDFFCLPEFLVNMNGKLSTHL